MQNNGSTPTRNRRADRYRQESGVSPSSGLLGRTGEAPLPPSVRHRRSGIPVQNDPTPGRGAAEPKSRPEPRQSQPLPKWLSALLVIALLLGLGLFAASWQMKAYLKTQQDARDQAFDSLVSRHPVQYQELIEHYAELYGLRPAYVTAIILNESSFNSRAESRVGARGLMQLMPETAAWIAGKIGVQSYQDDMLWDPETNIRFGCWYLSWLSERFGGDPVCVTAAYHAGQNQVRSWLSDRSISADGATMQVDSMPEGPTRTYAGRVTNDYAIYDALYYQAFNQYPVSVPDYGAAGG